MSTPYHAQLIKNRLIRIGAIPKPRPLPIQVTNYQRTQTLALYRAAIRETDKITHDNRLREFSLGWFKEHFRKNIEVMSEALLRTKLKRAQRELRCIRGVNQGFLPDLDRALHYAYARVGPARHEILQQLIAQPSAPSPRLIKSNPRSILPPYPPILRHLMTSEHTSDQPVPVRKLFSPPTLPERADPTSEDAHLLGPLPKRREQKIRWRYYGVQMGYVRVPLGAVGGPYPIVGIARDTIDRLERLAQGSADDGSKMDRTLTRAYRRLLGVTPITKYSPPDNAAAARERPTQSRPAKGQLEGDPQALEDARLTKSYQSSLSPLAVLPQRRAPMTSTKHLHFLPPSAQEWFNLSKLVDAQAVSHITADIPRKKLRKKMLYGAWWGGEEYRELERMLAGEIDWQEIDRGGVPTWKAEKMAWGTLTEKSTAPPST